MARLKISEVNNAFIILSALADLISDVYELKYDSGKIFNYLFAVIDNKIAAERLKNILDAYVFMNYEAKFRIGYDEYLDMPTSHRNYIINRIVEIKTEELKRLEKRNSK